MFLTALNIQHATGALAISNQSIHASNTNHHGLFRSLYSLETKYQGNFSKTESLFANVQLNLVKPEVTYIEDHEVYDLQSFIGEVGGTLGLMLGLSFSSVLDVMDLMAAKLFYSVDK